MGSDWKTAGHADFLGTREQWSDAWSEVSEGGSEPRPNSAQGYTGGSEERSGYRRRTCGAPDECVMGWGP